MSKEKKGTNWLLAIATLGLSEVYKKWGVKGLGISIVVLFIIGAIGGGNKKESTSTNNEVTQKEVKTEIKVDNSKAEKLAKAEAAKKKAEAEKNKDLSYNDFKLGMDRKDIPSSIKLKQTDLMSSKLNTYKYVDSNNNKITIGDYNLNISFVISNTTNKVHHIIYTSNNTKAISSPELKSLVSKLTNKPLKSQNISGVIKHYYKENINGIKYETFGLYGDKDTFLKGELQLIQRASDIKKTNTEINEMAKKVVEKKSLTDTFNYRGAVKVQLTAGCKNEDTLHNFMTYLNINAVKEYQKLLNSGQCRTFENGDYVFFKKGAFMKDGSMPMLATNKIKVIENGKKSYYYMNMFAIKFEGKKY